MSNNHNHIFAAWTDRQIYNTSENGHSILSKPRSFQVTLIILLVTVTIWSANIANGDTLISPDIQSVEDSLNVQTDSMLHILKTESDTILTGADSIKITSNPDSVGSDLTFDTSETPFAPSVFQKQEKGRRKSETWEYLGASRDADRSAQQVVLGAYRGDWNEVKRELDRLERIEKRNNLVKISRLLSVSVKTYRLEQDEFFSVSEKKSVERELDSCIRLGLSYAQECNDSCFALRELIYCGVKGFQLSRLIEKNPVEAAIQGYSVIVRLEKLLKIDSTMYDACMGLGLFYCSVATASPVIRAALTLTGRQISLEKGLSYLRIGAQKGHYVNLPSLVYLTQFLSPYLGHHVIEKDSIYQVLQKKCEQNPRYLFEQIDEYICFHPEKFTPEYVLNLKKKIAGYKNVHPHLQHYGELMKYQYCKYIDTLNCTFKIDADVDLKRFGFYPAFLDALRFKESCMIHSLGSFSKLHAKGCEKNIPEIIKKLESMPMVSTQKELYRWHILDAIKLR